MRIKRLKLTEEASLHPKASIEGISFCLFGLDVGIVRVNNNWQIVPLPSWNRAQNEAQSWIVAPFAIELDGLSIEGVQSITRHWLKGCHL